MPEGHSIHRYARLQRELLGGRTVAAWSPQGRFAAGARLIDGTVLRGIEAYGKHLFYRFAGSPPAGSLPLALTAGSPPAGSLPLALTAGSPPAGSLPLALTAGSPPAGSLPLALTLHVHLGLFGRFRQYVGDAQPPTPLTRLVLAADGVELQLAGPTICELLDPAAEAALRGRLGPDPLHDGDPGAAFAALTRRSAPIGQVLLDQRVIAGIGNVYRAEVLFLVGVAPNRPAHAVDRATFDRVWRLLRELMTDGERRGRIITLQPEDRTRPLTELIAEEERLYVYNRTGLPCRRCGTPIRAWDLAGRTVFACPRCQPS